MRVTVGAGSRALDLEDVLGSILWRHAECAQRRPAADTFHCGTGREHAALGFAVEADRYFDFEAARDVHASRHRPGCGAGRLLHFAGTGHRKRLLLWAADS